MKTDEHGIGAAARAWRRALAGAALALAALTPATATRAGAQEEGITVGAEAPAVALEDLDGTKVELSRYLGKRPIFIEYWATWCTVCADLMPRVRAAQKKYGKQVEFLGVNVAVNQTVSRVKRYAKSEKPPFRILYDEKGAATRAYRAPTTSYIVIIDRAGKVAYTGVGTEQKFEAALAAVAE